MVNSTNHTQLEGDDWSASRSSSSTPEARSKNGLEGVTILIPIWEAFGSDLGRGNGYHLSGVSWPFSVPPGECRNNISIGPRPLSYKCVRTHQSSSTCNTAQTGHGMQGRQSGHLSNKQMDLRRCQITDKVEAGTGMRTCRVSRFVPLPGL
jgi:hypothetical protein